MSSATSTILLLSMDGSRLSTNPRPIIKAPDGNTISQPKTKSLMYALYRISNCWWLMFSVRLTGAMSLSPGALFLT